MEPIINSQVPEFKVQAFQNGSFKTVSSEDIKGKWAIFFFYPADFTFVCPTELVDMADKYGKFQEMGVEVYSVSTDSHFVHKAWHDASETIRKIKYPMLADPTGALSRAFGVMIEEEGMAYRGTFLVNPEGKIKIAEIHDNGIGRNADELLRKVEAAHLKAILYPQIMFLETTIKNYALENILKQSGSERFADIYTNFLMTIKLFLSVAENIKNRLQSE